MTKPTLKFRPMRRTSQKVAAQQMVMQRELLRRMLVGRGGE